MPEIRDEVTVAIRTIVTDYLNVTPDSVTPATKLPARRLDRIELGMLIEKYLDVRLPRDGFPGICTIADLATLVRSSK